MFRVFLTSLLVAVAAAQLVTCDLACENDGVCTISSLNVTSCVCPPGFAGEQCEDLVQPEIICKSVGDPHIRRFNGKTVHCQTFGDQLLYSTDDITITGKTRDSFRHAYRQVSVNEGFAIEYNGYTITGHRPVGNWRTNPMTVSVVDEAGATIIDASTVANIQTGSVFPGAEFTRVTATKLKIRFPSLNLKFIVQGRGRAVALYIVTVDSNVSGEGVSGLCKADTCAMPERVFEIDEMEVDCVVACMSNGVLSNMNMYDSCVEDCSMCYDNVNAPEVEDGECQDLECCKELAAEYADDAAATLGLVDLCRLHLGETACTDDDTCSWNTPFSGEETCYGFNGEDSALALNDIDAIKGNRWGWSNEVLLEEVGTTGSMDLWAGAGQNDLSKGTLVGSVDYSYSPDTNTLTVTYNTVEENLLKEVHLYVGSVQVDTVANGEYPYTRDADGIGEASISFDIGGLDPGTYYIVAHGVAVADPGFQSCVTTNPTEFELQTVIDSLDYWGPWISRQTNGGKDSNLPRAYFDNTGQLPCSEPIDIECRSATTGLPTLASTETFRTECSLTAGLKCFGADQSDDGSCDKYEVRFKCTEMSGLWGPWDSTHGLEPIYTIDKAGADYETRYRWEEGGHMPCADPIGIQCRRISDGVMSTATGETFKNGFACTLGTYRQGDTVNQGGGIVCEPNNLDGSTCSDYEVRYQCHNEGAAAAWAAALAALAGAAATIGGVTVVRRRRKAAARKHSETVAKTQAEAGEIELEDGMA